MNRLYGLYGISDCKLTPYVNIFQYLESAISGGLRIFQLRDKIHSDNDIEGLARELQDFCHSKDVLFIINDRYKLALKINADGIHLGRDELDCFQDLRNSFSGIIGISCYASIESAMYYEDLGADYVAFGAFFPSHTKPNATTAPVTLLKEAKVKCKIPICAIGGINVSNVGLLRDADMIAVISSLWSNDNLSLPCESSNFIRYNASSLLLAWKS
ncbi:thiamine phosphate synthase [Helicobacter muridarum]|nr:thiamine phosphate synthase [Helicobacter muridarum]STQ86054.1 thiamine monophosphate synthase [Helicobacter muridarum]